MRLGDLITLLIIAKGGQCKDVYVPEIVQVGSQYMCAKHHAFPAFCSKHLVFRPQELRYTKRTRENSVTVSAKVLVQNRCKFNGTFNHKTFNADRVRLACSKHTRSLASEEEFL